MRCRQCRNHVIQKSDGGAVHVRIQGKITIDKDGCHAQCYFCRSPVVVPLELAKSADSAPISTAGQDVDFVLVGVGTGRR